MSSQTPTDPDHDKLSSSCLDLLLIELVPLAYRIAADLHAKEVLLTRTSTQNTLDRASLTSTTTTSTLRNQQQSGAQQQQQQHQGEKGSLALPDRSSVLSEGGSTSAEKGGAATATTTTTEAGSVTVGGGNEEDAQDDDEAREAVFWRLDALGYRVGQGLVER